MSTARRNLKYINISNMGGTGTGMMGGNTTGIKTFDTVLTTVGCTPAFVTAIKNSNISSLEHVLTWTEKEVDKMIKTFREAGVEILPNVEKNFQLMVGEAQIRHQTNRKLADMYDATIQDFVHWQYRQSEKGNLSTHQRQISPMPRICQRTG
jgi:biotin operon repressor